MSLGPGVEGVAIVGMVRDIILVTKGSKIGCEGVGKPMPMTYSDAIYLETLGQDSDLTQLYRGWTKSRLIFLTKRAMALIEKVEEEGQKGVFEFEEIKANRIEFMEYKGAHFVHVVNVWNLG